MNDQLILFMSRQVDKLLPRYSRRRRLRVFEHAYLANVWGDAETVSGPGSKIARAALFQADFQKLIQDLSIRTMLDCPCGDYNWLRSFDLEVDHYCGVDIVPQLISQNQRLYSNGSRQFLVRDMVCDELPRADMIVCRDGLVHLSNRSVKNALRNFIRTGSAWLLTNTFVNRQHNSDIRDGAWRTLNLEAAPFNLPPPARLIDEQCLGYDGVYRDKRLGLWRLDSIKL